MTMDEKDAQPWLENMLAYASHLLSQLADLSPENIERDSKGFAIYPVSTGPTEDPDRYDIRGLLKEIRKSRPCYC